MMVRRQKKDTVIERRRTTGTARLGCYHAAVHVALAELAAQRVMQRIWACDHTVWKPEPAEITNRLGWLNVAAAMRERVPELRAFVEEVRAAGYSHALLLGMGGSSLAPELFSKTFACPGYLHLAVLDSTDPAAVLAQAQRLDPLRTLFIVSTKSGGTVETFSLFKYFYNWAAAALGAEEVGKHFVAITDAGSGLAKAAEQYRFRAIFLNDPNIGGRYSALSYFGLVPAALLGVDIALLLERALAVASASGPRVATEDNPSAWLGVILGELAKAGRDKATFVVAPQIASFGDWVEQLLAESSGKEGRGIVPIIGEPLGSADVYGGDRFFVHLRLEGAGTRPGKGEDAEQADAAALDALECAGYPVLRLHLQDAYDLGGQFFLWELATAVAGQRLGINPFDQPNVEAAKVRAREMVAAYTRSGALPSEPATLSGEGMMVFGETSAGSAVEALPAFISQGQAGDYVALQAYLQPTAETDAALLALRTWLRDRYRLATTVGYGPRFLHSTGQLHKGDAGRGLFIQFTADDVQDVPIPDEAGAPASSITFGVLKAAQALGDWQALRDAGRRVLRFHLGTDVIGGLTRLMAVL